MTNDQPAARLNRTQLPFAVGPFSWEYIAERPEGERYRIHDSKDDAVGSAATEAHAIDMVRRLNGGR
jgi:hypothetical protein